MKKCLEDAASKYQVTVAGKTTKASVESHVERDYSSMDVPDSSHVVQLVLKAAARMGLDVKTMASGGGCDANVFNRKGIECANLGTGMRAIHTVNEWLDVKDMYASAEMARGTRRRSGELPATRPAAWDRSHLAWGPPASLPFSFGQLDEQDARAPPTRCRRSTCHAGRTSLSTSAISNA